MGHLDEQLKQLSNVHRDEEAKMKTYHQAKAQLYTREKAPRKAMGKLLGIPLTVMAALFIGFLLSYQWLGDNLFVPGTDEEEEGKLITEDIAIAYVMEGAQLDWILEGANPDAKEIEDVDVLRELKETLNSPINKGEVEDIVDEPFLPFYPALELRVEQVDGTVLLFRIGEENGSTFVWQANSEVYYYYGVDLWDTIVGILFGDPEVEEEILSFEYIDDALAVFSQSDVRLPRNTEYQPYHIKVLTYQSEPIEMFIHYRDDNEVAIFTFRVQANEYGDRIRAIDPAQAVMETFFDQAFYYADHSPGSRILQWEEEEFTYVVEMHEMNKEQALNMVIAPILGAEPIDFDVETPVEKYNVFADYELYHPTTGMSEGLSFYVSTETGYVLGYGHQGHAVGRYDLYRVSEEGDQVTRVRFMSGDGGNEQIVSEWQQSAGWEERLIQYMLENMEELEEVFFKYEDDVLEAEITFDGQTFVVYPVQIGDNINYFKEGKGVWMKYRGDQMIIDFLGEPQQITRVIDR